MNFVINGGRVALKQPCAQTTKEMQLCQWKRLGVILEI